MYPVSIGAIAPAKLPTKFCTPAHRPAPRGPAHVCPTAQQVPPAGPMKRPASDSSQTKIASGATAAAIKETPKPTDPVPSNALRTRVVEVPPAIHRSEIFPLTNAETANIRKITPPARALSFLQKRRSRPNTDGQHGATQE